VIAVIVSGAGTDGAMGAMVVHRCGGPVLTSGGASSAYFSMPSTAIREDGVVDRVLPVTEIAPQLLTLVDRSIVAVAPDPVVLG
jgi:chemotaxis response regulator CheB